MLDLVSKFVNLLIENNLRIVTAESITGGLIASTLISIPKISQVLKESFIVYSDEAKIKQLGVSEETIKTYTAVSSQTCNEMMEGLYKKIPKANVVLTSTGYADGEFGGKVFLGIGFNKANKVYEKTYKGERNDIREQAVYDILNLAYETVSKNVSHETFLWEEKK